MPARLKRYYGLGHLHFLTFSCYQRRPLLGSAGARNLFVQVLGAMRERYGFLVVGYVVMPEHVHLLIGEPAESDPSIVLKALKQRVARELRGKSGNPAAGPLRWASPDAETSLPHFWQPRFHDFNVHSANKRREKLDYMHANPVKRGLVTNPLEWIWSSASFYATGAAGLVPIDPVP